MSLLPQEWPKWVTPHASHIIKAPDTPAVVVGFEFHEERAGNVTVLVRDADEEAVALAEKGAPVVEHDAEPAIEHDEEKVAE